MVEGGGARHVCGENEKDWKLGDERKSIVFVRGGERYMTSFGSGCGGSGCCLHLWVSVLMIGWRASHGLQNVDCV
jgi:hypothetical protein